jgi:hypothetical protein
MGDLMTMKAGGMLLASLLAMSCFAQGAKQEDKMGVGAKWVPQVLTWMPEKPEGFSTPITHRVIWDSTNVQSVYRGRFLKTAEQALKTPLPKWDNEAYLEFSVNGGRDKGQKMIGDRRRAFMACVYMECVENKGRFLPYILDAMQAYCDEPCWTLPAHDRSLSNFKRKQYTIDLASSAFAYQLANVTYMLGDKVPPSLKQKIVTTIDERIYKPIELAVITLPNGKTTEWWTECDHNWNSVCWNGVVGATLTLHPDKLFRAKIIAAALVKIQLFLEGFPKDGYCYEGTGYWNYGFSNFLYLREMIWQLSKGKYDLCKDEKVDQVVRYGLRIEVLPGLSPAFGDCGLGTRPSKSVLQYCNQTMNLQLPGVEPLAADPLLCTDFCDLVPRSISSPYATASVKPEKPYGFYFNSATIMISKMADFSYGAAIKAGGNGNHSHNDIGSYMIAVGGKTITGDAGGPKRYTADVFSGKRYTFPILNSYGHPVPYIDGIQQAVGTKVKPIVLRATQNEKQDSYVIDMRPAYPSVKNMTMLERDYLFDREARTITVEDRFSATENKTFETAIVLTGSFKTNDTTTLELINEKLSIQARVVASSPVELIPEKLPNFGSEFTRIAVRFKEPLQKGSVKIVYTVR